MPPASHVFSNVCSGSSQRLSQRRESSRKHLCRDHGRQQDSLLILAPTPVNVQLAAPLLIRLGSIVSSGSARGRTAGGGGRLHWCRSCWRCNMVASVSLWSLSPLILLQEGLWQRRSSEENMAHNLLCLRLHTICAPLGYCSHSARRVQAEMRPAGGDAGQSVAAGAANHSPANKCITLLLGVMYDRRKRMRVYARERGPATERDAGQPAESAY